MRRYVQVVRALCCGAISLGILQAVQQVSFNQIWFDFLRALLNAVVAALFGGSPTGAALFGGLFGSFGNLFV